MAETKQTITQRLNSIQQELKAPKNQMNKFGGYKYRSCEDILEAVKPLLNGLVLSISDEIVSVDGRFYIKATASLFDEAGQTFSASALAREAEIKKGMDEAQITGSASSYARKYALNGLFAIDDTKDADDTNTHGKTETNKPVVCPIHNATMVSGIGKNGQPYTAHKMDNGEWCHGAMKNVEDVKARIMKGLK